jgi:hypothetical protein
MKRPDEHTCSPGLYHLTIQVEYYMLFGRTSLLLSEGMTPIPACVGSGMGVSVGGGTGVSVGGGIGVSVGGGGTGVSVGAFGVFVNFTVVVGLGVLVFLGVLVGLGVGVGPAVFVGVGIGVFVGGTTGVGVLVETGGNVTVRVAGIVFVAVTSAVEVEPGVPVNTVFVRVGDALMSGRFVFVLTEGTKVLVGVADGEGVTLGPVTGIKTVAVAVSDGTGVEANKNNGGFVGVKKSRAKAS